MSFHGTSLRKAVILFGNTLKMRKTSNPWHTKDTFNRLAVLLFLKATQKVFS